jgi:predicted enzyme related to lactoylglutathione lyase
MVAAKVKFALHEPMSPAQESKIGQQRLYFRIEDLAAHHSRVLAWGGDAGEIKKTDWMDMFLIRDPDGNEIIFAFTDPDRHAIYPWNTDVPAAKGDE